MMNLRFLAACLCSCLFLCEPPALRAADFLRWDDASGRATAQIDSTDLPSVLTQIGLATGWQIYVEPGIAYRVSTRFQDVAPAEALKLIIGDLHFALLSQRSGPTRLFVFKNSLQDATQMMPTPLAPDPGPGEGAAVPNELVVRLKPGQGRAIEELVARLGAKITGRIDGQRAYRLQFADEAAAMAARGVLAANSDVADIESNYSIPLPSKPQVLQLSSPLPFQLKPNAGAGSGPVIVGLIDSPVQPLGQGMQDFLLPAIQISSKASSESTELSHGTAMAETILRATAQASPGSGSSVRILPVDVYGPNAATTTFAVAQGIVAAVNAGATVINMSLTGPGKSQLVADLVNQAHRAGVMLFGAAGNEPTTQLNYPAALPEVIAVTSGDRKGNIASYANRGSFVDVVAPGVSLVQLRGTSYLVTGTSAATAYVSGLAAGLRADKKSAADVEVELRAGLAPKPAGTK